MLVHCGNVVRVIHPTIHSGGVLGLLIAARQAKISPGVHSTRVATVKVWTDGSW